MNHLAKLVDFAKRDTCQFVSVKQRSFFQGEVKRAIATHKAMGLPVEISDNKRGTTGATFYMDNGDTFTSDNYFSFQIAEYGSQCGHATSSFGKKFGK